MFVSRVLKFCSERSMITQQLHIQPNLFKITEVPTSNLKIQTSRICNIHHSRPTGYIKEPTELNDLGLPSCCSLKTCNCRTLPYRTLPTRNPHPGTATVGSTVDNTMHTIFNGDHLNSIKYLTKHNWFSSNHKSDWGRFLFYLILEIGVILQDTERDEDILSSN